MIQETKFKKRMKKLMKERGWNQEDIAEKTNYSIDTVKGWFRDSNRREPTSDAIYKLAKLFDVSSDYLLGIEEEKESYNIKFISDYTGLSSESINNLNLMKAYVKDGLDKMLSDSEISERFLKENYKCLFLRTGSGIKVKNKNGDSESLDDYFDISRLHILDLYKERKNKENGNNTKKK